MRCWVWSRHPAQGIHGIGVSYTTGGVVSKGRQKHFQLKITFLYPLRWVNSGHVVLQILSSKGEGSFLTKPRVSDKQPQFFVFAIVCMSCLPRATGKAWERDPFQAQASTRLPDGPWGRVEMGPAPCPIPAGMAQLRRLPRDLSQFIISIFRKRHKEQNPFFSIFFPCSDLLSQYSPLDQ